MDEVLSAEAIAEIAASMGIASTAHVRGQRDTIGFATRAEQMEACVRAAAEPPRPIRLVPPTRQASGPVGGAIAPHDDYVYAGRIYREVIPHITAPIVIVIGVFHRYWRLGVRERLGFDAYERWRTPEGSIEVSSLREAWRSRFAPSDHYVSNACHDLEHSIEALVYWLHHARSDRQIVPVLAPGAAFPRLVELARTSGAALAEALTERKLALGPDVAIVISADAIHYGEDFAHTPFGAGGPSAYAQAVARDRSLLEAMKGEVREESARSLFETLVDPAAPDTYRVPWCGRFSIPFGMLLLRELCEQMGRPAPIARPLAYGTSIDPPALALRDAGLGVTAPANDHHFVGHPGLLFT